MNKYDKYIKLFNYAGKIAFELYKKDRDLFKQIPMDGNDVKQEVYIAVMKAIDIYEKKYQNEEKVYLMKYIKDLTKNTLRNLLRDNAKKSFFAVEKKCIEENKKEDEKEEQKEKILSKIDIRKMLKERRSNNRITTVSKIIEDILRKYSGYIEGKNNKNQPIEYKIIYSRIIKDRTFKEIAKHLNISRTRVWQIYKRVIDKIKKEVGEDLKDLV